MSQTGFTPIQLYRTTTAAAVPVNTNLADGELAINTTDEKLYFKNAAGTVKLLASTSGSAGDVVGPASAVDSSLAAFDGTTGKLIKNASLTANNVLLGNGTGAPLVVAPGTSGNILTSNGTTWTSAAPAGDVTLTGTQTLTNKTIEAGTFTNGYTEEVFAVTGTTPALSPTNGSIQTWTLSANSTPTAGTWADGQSLTLMIDDGTAFTITWTSLAVTWKTGGGTAPTLNTTGVTAIQLWEVGNVIYGARVGDA